MKAETDERLPRLTKLWCEELYAKKYGITCPWSGREAKQLQRLLSYLAKNFGKDRAEEKARELFVSYLADPKIEDKGHPFGWMCVRPQEWLKSKIVQEEKSIYVCPHCSASGLVIWENEAHRCQCSNGDKCSEKIRRAPSEAFVKDERTLLEKMCEAKDQVSLFRGFVQTKALLKIISPKEYENVRTYWLELFGKEKAIEMYREAEKKIANSNVLVKVGA